MTQTSLGPRFSAAVAYAVEVHHGQVRKGSTTPYLSHLLATASTVMHCGGSEDGAIAAILHDAVEDQPEKASIESIQQRFGARVAELVEAVTELPKSQPWPVRKDAYEEQLATADDEAVLVSMADKAHNLATLVDDLRAHGAGVWGKFKAGKEACIARYERLMRLYHERLGHMSVHRAILDRMENDLEVARG